MSLVRKCFEDTLSPWFKMVCVIMLCLKYTLDGNSHWTYAPIKLMNLWFISLWVLFSLRAWNKHKINTMQAKVKCQRLPFALYFSWSVQLWKIYMLENKLAKKIPALPVSPSLCYTTYRYMQKRQNGWYCSYLKPSLESQENWIFTHRMQNLLINVVWV